VVGLDQVGTAGSEAGGRLDEVGPQRALTEHDLIWVQVEVLNNLKERSNMYIWSTELGTAQASSTNYFLPSRD
jgi:hypothetical protein